MRLTTFLLRLKALAILSVLLLSLPVCAQPGNGGGNGGDGIWRRNAYYGELLTFDSCVGHQPQNGQYHYHASPRCLRAQLNDNLVVLRSSRNGSIYSELKSGWHHSPILGWATDGYPIYGPYGYSDPKDPNSAVQRIKSGFRLRAITKRTTLPDWVLPNHANVSQNLAATQAGPDVSTNFPLGRYVEDYEWAAGVGDLDQYNGRTTVTPEYPNGTYAYYVTIEDDGTPAFPYIVAAQFYGAVSGGFQGQASASASDYFNAGTSSAGPGVPALTSWATKNSTLFAKVVSGFDPSAGPSTTWGGTNILGVTTSGSATSPVLAEAQRIRFIDTTVYVSSNNLASHTMGPWFSADMPGGVFVNFPASNSVNFQMPRAPAPATTHTSTGMGPQGLWVNGVVMFNFLDGASYINNTGVDGQAGNTPALDAAVTSAASFEQGPQAPGSLASAFPLFFSVLSTSTDSATSPNWPLTLGGTTVQVRDSAGTSVAAQISYASPAQINFRIPTGLASGAGTVVIQAGGKTITSRVNIQPVYPNLFMINVNGLAAGSFTRVTNGVASTEPVTAPVALNGDQVYLTVYGSGLGNAASATATIGGVPAPVTYAGQQGTFGGLDQYNILIPSAVSGMGQVNVVVTAGGKASNPVNITVK